MKWAIELEKYRKILLQHPQHVIMPFYRQQIYQMIDPEHNNFFREWLGVICAKFVLPIWEDYSDNPMPSRMIVEAEKFLRKETKADEADKLGDEGWEWLDNISHTSLGFMYGYSAYAALLALNEALGFDPFEGYDLNEDWLDDNIDLDSSDVTNLAYCAYAGYPDVYAFDPQRCLKFFTWWFDQAIPQAWQLAQSNTQQKI